MILTKEQAVEIIKSPKSKILIENAKQHESVLRVFTETFDETELQSEFYWQELLKKMQARAPKKVARVLQFARYPLPVSQITESILKDFYKVFDGKNRHFNINADRDINSLQDWVDKCNLEKWIEEKAKDVFKNKPVSFVVIDKDSQGVPYLVYVDSNRIIDAVFKEESGDLEYIAFVHSVDKDIVRYAVYDSEKYLVLEKNKNSESFVEVSSNLHEIGYCPARTFMSSTCNDQNFFKRKSAFANSISKLEDWTIFDIFRNYVDHYAPFPVTEAPKKSCPNPDCVNGYILTEEVPDVSKPHETRTKYLPCETCQGDDGTNIYPGTHIGIKVSSDPQVKDGSNVFKMIFPDTDKMEYIPKKLDELELEIRHKTVGLNYMQSSNEAMNEMQLKGSFASMESVLIDAKTELDDLYKWIVKTVGKIFYKNSDISVDANFGTEFYLITEEELQQKLKSAKEIGMPIDEQLSIYKQLIQTKYKGNPIKQKRQQMLIDIDIYPMNSVKDCIELKKENVIDDFELSLKANFLNFINRFETENINITQFGINLEYKQRIDLIKKVLYLYNQELIDAKNLRNNSSSNDDENTPAVIQE